MKTGSFFNRLLKNEQSPISLASKMLGHVSYNHKVPEVDVFYDIQLILDSDKSLNEKTRFLHGIITFYKKQGNAYLDQNNLTEASRAFAIARQAEGLFPKEVQHPANSDVFITKINRGLSKLSVQETKVLERNIQKYQAHITSKYPLKSLTI